MSGDLVGGRFPLTYPFSKALALASNNAQSNISVRSNLEYLGLSGLSNIPATVWQGGAGGGKATLVPVPVENGDLIQFVDVLVGTGAAGTPTHSWAALYSSTGALVGSQSVDGGAAAIAAAGRFTFTLGSKYIVNPTDSPNGILYAAISQTATTCSDLIGATTSVPAQYAWYTGMPVFLGGTSGSGLVGVAPASITLSSVTPVAAQPAVFLR
jgi:hypothetical protein